MTLANAKPIFSMESVEKNNKPNDAIEIPQFMIDMFTRTEIIIHKDAQLSKQELDEIINKRINEFKHKFKYLNPHEKEWLIEAHRESENEYLEEQMRQVEFERLQLVTHGFEDILKKHLQQPQSNRENK
jgi:hypothetical protein